MTRRLATPLQFLSLLTALAAVSAAAADPPGGARLVAKLPGPAGTATAFSRDGKLLLTAGGDEARVWDTRSWEPVTPPLRHAGHALASATLAADGKTALTVAGTDVRVWDVPAGTLRCSLRHADVPVAVAAVSPDGSRVVTTAGESQDWKALPEQPAPAARLARLWDTATGTLVAELDHPGFARFPLFSPSGDRIVTLSTPTFNGWVGTAFLWNARDGRKVAEAPDAVEGSRAATFSADGRRLAVAGWYKAEVHDPIGGKKLLTIDPFKHCEIPMVAAISPDGTKLATVTQFSVRFWHAGTGRPWGDPLEEYPRDVIFMPDSKRVLLTSQFHVHLWDVVENRFILQIESAGFSRGFPAAAPSPDGRHVAAGFDGDGFTGIWQVPEPTRP